MAFGKDTFVDGDKATGAQAVAVYFDFAKDGTFVEACLTSAGEDVNQSVQTYMEICRNGQTSTNITGYDPEWKFKAMLSKGYITAEMWSKRYEPTTVANIPMKITNALIDEELNVNVTLLGFTITYSPGDLIEVEFSAKPTSGGVVVTDITYVPTPNPAKTKKTN